jgi:hypothetical protein
MFGIDPCVIIYERRRGNVKYIRISFLTSYPDILFNVNILFVSCLLCAQQLLSSFLVLTL